MNVVVDQLLTHYELTGKGKLVLLLHGWGDSAAGLNDLQTALAKHYQVLSVDLPGFGATQAPETAWDLDNYAHFLRNFLDKLKLKTPHAVIGHSNGGALAIRALAAGQLQSGKLVLVAAAGIRDRHSARKLALKAVAKTGKVATVWLPQNKRRKLRKALYGVSGSDMLVMPQLQETFRRTVRQDVQADAAQLSLPALLIYARDDRAVPLSYGQRYHHLIKGSKLEVIDQAGHFVHLDQAVQVTALIEEFLR